MENFFTIATPVIYWILIVIWSYILFFYITKIKSIGPSDKLLRLLLIVLAIDSFRTVFESAYFGAWYTSLSKIIPIEVFNYLAQPQIVFIPKIINLIAAVLILTILVRKWIGSEIEEKEKSELALLKSYEKHKIIIETAIDGFLITDKEGQIVDVNNAYCEMSGYNKDELLSMTIFDLDKNESKEELTGLLRDISEQGNTSIETIHQKKDNTGYNVRIKIQFHDFADGQYIIFIEDITERKESEKQLLKKHMQLTKVQEIGLLGTWELDIVNNELVWTDQVYHNFGIEPGTPLTYELFLNTVHPDDREYVDSEWSAALKGKPYDIDHRIIVDGNIKWIREKAEIKYDGKGQPIKAIGFTQDITQHKLAEQGLRSFQLEREAWTENSPICTKKVDLDFNLRFMSEAGIRDLKVDNIDDYLGAPYPFHFFPKEIKIAMREKLKEAKETLKIVELDGILTDTLGNKMWYHHIIVPVKNNNNQLDYLLVLSNDITDRKKAELDLIAKNKEYEDLNEKLKTANKQLSKAKEQAEENEQKFSQLFTNVSDAIFTYDPVTFEIFEANQATSDIYGYSHDELIGMSCLKFSAEVEKSKSVAKSILSTGKITVNLRHHKKKDGTDIYVELTTHNIKVNDKNIYYSVCHDITDIKKAEFELVKAKETAEWNEANLAVITDLLNETGKMAKVGGWEINIRDKSLKWTEETFRIHELSNNKQPTIEEAVNFYHPEDREKVSYLVEKALLDGESFEFEARIITHKNNHIWVRSNGYVKKKNGENVSLRGSFQDITQIKNSQTELIAAKKKAEESEYKVRSMFENTQIGIMFCNTAGDIIEINQMIADILGSPSIEATKKINLLKFKPLIDIGFAPNLKKCINEKRVIVEDSVYTSKWGKTVFMKYYLVPVIVDDEVIGVWINLNNLSDIYYIQNKLKLAKEKAEESDRLKSAFLANMSHEIRTPMNGILGFTDLLMTPDLTGAQREKYTEIINRSGKRMLNTVNDIIDISKIDAGQVEIVGETIDINNEIENQFEFFYGEATARGLDLKLTNNLPKNSTIVIDKQKLQSIVSNLIKNALKYTDNGSIEIVCDKIDEKLNIKIIDTGIGIPENRVKSVFNRFEQADIRDIHAREGSGLGLSISKAYVDLLGGDISVESEEGKGSTFYFTVPWVEDKENYLPTVEKVTAINKQINNQLNILIAEDDDISYNFLEIIFEDITKSIKRASNGKEAVDLMKKHDNFDMVFMDIKMPVMDGYQATSEIRKFNKDVIIIAQTAYALKGDDSKVIEAGCDDYITKPINRDSLIDLIKKYKLIDN